MGIGRGYEIIILALIVLVLFGAKRLPDSARALGKSLRILKSETRAMREDGGDDKKVTATVTDAEPAAKPQPQVIEARTITTAQAPGEPQPQAQQVRKVAGTASDR